MKPAKILCLLCLVMLAACKKNKVDESTDPAVLIGTWTLTERLADPGDGSGTFQAVNEEKTITFYSNGTFSCTGPTCTTGSGSGGSQGTYNTADLTLTPNTCPYSGMNTTYIHENNTLILSFPCFEACREKFVK